MRKQIYISADYSKEDGDYDVVEVLNRWGNDDKHIVNFIDMSKVNMSLFQTGSIAFFKDDITGTLMAMPYTIVGSLDYYGRPQAIMPLPYFGAYKRFYEKNI